MRLGFNRQLHLLLSRLNRVEKLLGIPHNPTSKKVPSEIAPMQQDGMSHRIPSGPRLLPVAKEIPAIQQKGSNIKRKVRQRLRRWLGEKLDQFSRQLYQVEKFFDIQPQLEDESVSHVVDSRQGNKSDLRAVLDNPSVAQNRNNCLGVSLQGSVMKEDCATNRSFTNNSTIPESECPSYPLPNAISIKMKEMADKILSDDPFLTLNQEDRSMIYEQILMLIKAENGDIETGLDDSFPASNQNGYSSRKLLNQKSEIKAEFVSRDLLGNSFASANEICFENHLAIDSVTMKKEKIDTQCVSMGLSLKVAETDRLQIPKRESESFREKRIHNRASSGTSFPAAEEAASPKNSAGQSMFKSKKACKRYRRRLREQVKWMRISFDKFESVQRLLLRYRWEYPHQFNSQVSVKAIVGNRPIIQYDLSQFEYESLVPPVSILLLLLYFKHDQ
ncbi:hypothetical protein QAD02_014542 [Eretmocerus hayati]|uniref:Uncharacterized protein n=1 Tax=Eretmocerus hayati TaxID=131215 RepID=A0ACC2P5T8_9HYME|nr:hypothetical protein QAD02_014542 [Eretmocerus hayati]